MSISPPACQFCLPDLLSACPLKDETNPYYKEAAAESRAWINSYDVFTDRKRAFFIQGQNELLCSHVYSYASAERFRTTCDFVNLLFVIDETSDEQNGNDAKATGRSFVRALKYSNWDDGTTIFRITKDFRTRFMRHAGDNNARRFFNLCEVYMEAVGKEAELRERGEVLGLEEFILHRRQNSGIMACFTLAEYVLGFDFDDKVYEDPIFLDAYLAACDYVCWSNDVYSYDREQSKGLMGSNVMTVLMKDKGLSLQEASDYVGNYCGHLLNTYLKARKQLPKFLGPEATQFIYSIGHWMIGSVVWSFETARYFGSRHLEVKETRVVTLRPREHTHDDNCEFSDEPEE